MTPTASAVQAPVAIEGLTVRYGSTVAVDRVGLTVPEGAVYALLGRNGAGKSSLVRCLLGQRRPDGGRVLLFGQDAWTGRARAMAWTGVVPEEPDAPPEMTSAELNAFVGRLHARWDGAAVAARLARFGVPDRVPFGRLSKGQKAQVLLALALGHQPRLLVLDDPTLGLDVVARREVFAELVAELSDRGTTVFITTHDLAGIEPVASRVGILRQGKLVLDEDLEAVKGRFRQVRLGQGAGPADAAMALGDLQPVAVRQGPFGLEAVVSNYNDLAYGRVRARGVILEEEPAALSLEEIFAAMAGPAGGAL